MEQKIVLHRQGSNKEWVVNGTHQTCLIPRLLTIQMSSTHKLDRSQFSLTTYNKQTRFVCLFGVQHNVNTHFVTYCQAGESVQEDEDSE